MKRTPWLLICVACGVAAVHLLLLTRGALPASVTGQGAWRVAGSQAVRVRTTVQAAVPSHTGAQPAPYPVREAAQTPPPAAAAVPPMRLDALPKMGEALLSKPSPAHYLSLEQVDAAPRLADGEWQLDFRLVPPGKAWVVRVQLWVAASGQIDHVETLDAQPNEPWVKQMLAPLMRTEVLPGMLAGQPVPVTYVVQMAPDQLQ